MTCRNSPLSRALSPQVSRPSPFRLTVFAAPEETISIATLLKGGWQIAGYTSTLDSRSAFILFRHPDEPYLVQCRASYDVTRTPPAHFELLQASVAARLTASPSHVVRRCSPPAHTSRGPYRNRTT